MMVNTVVVVVVVVAAAVLQKMCYGSMMELSWEGEEGILLHYFWVIKFLVKSLAIRPCDAVVVVAGPLSLQGRQWYWHCFVVLPLLGLGSRFRRHVGPRMMTWTQQTLMMIPTYSACEVSRVAVVAAAGKDC